jgi:hypothetical protein
VAVLLDTILRGRATVREAAAAQSIDIGEATSSGDKN